MQADSKKRWDSMDNDLCQACHAYGSDKRNLILTCFYEITESVPEFIDLHNVYDEGNPLRDFYYMRICKRCRSKFLEKLKEWFRECEKWRNTPKDHDGHPEEYDEDQNIPVRIDGAMIMMNADEFKNYNRKKEENRNGN